MDIPVVILAGGIGSRLSEETLLKPKPMVEIGNRPIMWHIMKHFSFYGHKNFIICLGYKGYQIKEWFANYYLYNNDVTIDLKNNSIKNHNNICEDWTVTLVDTGEHTMTGGRIKRIINSGYIKGETFFMTYGDGLSDVNLEKLVKTHFESNRLATLTAVQPESRFGKLEIFNGAVTSFGEKKDAVGQYINGGFMLLNKNILPYINGDDSVFEKDTLENLSKDGSLGAYYHNGFWFAMDTLHHKKQLEEMWNTGKPPWKLF